MTAGRTLTITLITSTIHAFNQKQVPMQRRQKLGISSGY